MRISLIIDYLKPYQLPLTINTDILVILCSLLGIHGCMQAITRKMRRTVYLGEREGVRPAQTQLYHLILLVLFILSL